MIRDILLRLAELQADLTRDREYYIASTVVGDAIVEIARLRALQLISVADAHAKDLVASENAKYTKARNKLNEGDL